MQRALDLARNGFGSVSPNPMVGCVLVKEGQVIGEGWHKQYGGPHAEVNAVESVGDPDQIEGCTAYVSLEPCSHHGKTPPCADLLIRHKVGRVVICHVDTNPLVGGKGIEKLVAAGIKAEAGVLAEEGRWINRRFLSHMERKRPYIFFKWAQTSDGFIARSNYDSRWISGALSRKLVHKWRTEEDSILVGRHTAQQDNPQLTARNWPGKNPLRIVIDRHGRLPETLHLFDGSVPTLRYTLGPSRSAHNLETITLPGEDFWQEMLADLHERKVQSIFIEGGTTIIADLLRRGLWDEARVFTAPSRFGEGIAAPAVKGLTYRQEQVGDDRLDYLLNPDHYTIPDNRIP